jgi:hypothetical protein
MGQDDAPEGYVMSACYYSAQLYIDADSFACRHMEVLYDNVRIPESNIIAIVKVLVASITGMFTGRAVPSTLLTSC